jgi:hypothetical protein
VSVTRRINALRAILDIHFLVASVTFSVLQIVVHARPHSHVAHAKLATTDQDLPAPPALLRVQHAVVQAPARAPLVRVASDLAAGDVFEFVIPIATVTTAVHAQVANQATTRHHLQDVPDVEATAKAVRTIRKIASNASQAIASPRTETTVKRFQYVETAS